MTVSAGSAYLSATFLRLGIDRELRDRELSNSLRELAAMGSFSNEEYFLSLDKSELSDKQEWRAGKD